MAGEHILIVDDERAIQAALRGVLEDEGYRVTAVGSAAEALAGLADETPDLIFLDIWMPGMDGLETLAEIKQRRPESAVVMISGHGTIETAVKATKLGAYDFIEKPLSLEKTLLAAVRALEHSRLERENRSLREQLERGQELVGKSTLIDELRAQIAVAAPTNGRVLIHGENGAGKELVARAIHTRSARREGPFVEVNCAAIPEELIESELFGHERGAFTGAVARHRGKFEAANAGTLFLDEIGDMSLKTQAKVLRALEEQAFERVGGKETIRVDVRVLAASNQDLPELIAQGRFREDLFYRLNARRTFPPSSSTSSRCSPPRTASG
jgi:two-component system nitrogen regulation response regulator NtrX